MGGEEKKPEEQKMEEKKPEEGKKEEKEEAKQTEKPAEEKKDEKKPEESKGDKDGKESMDQITPPEIVLKVYMHCEGCARKVRRSLKGFPGVEDVITDCKTHKVVVKGEKADPQKVLDRVQRKSHRQVELISPIPNPPTKEEKKPEEKVKTPPEEKKEEPQIITVVLRVHMHCEACAQEIKRRIQKMKGVESAEPDLKKSQVSVTGVFDAAKLVEFVYKRTGKQAVIVKEEAEKKEKTEEVKEAKEETKKAEAEGGGEKEKKEEGGGGGGGESDNKEKKEGEVVTKAAEAADEEEAATEETQVVEMKRSEYQYYPPRYVMEMYAYPPQIFSDENPNACTVM